MDCWRCSRRGCAFRKKVRTKENKNGMELRFWASGQAGAQHAAPLQRRAALLHGRSVLVRGRGAESAQHAAPLQRLGLGGVRRARYIVPLRRGGWALHFVFCVFACALSSCKPAEPAITVGSKFFTEQVVLGELLAQHIEARTGIRVKKKSNLGGTLLCQKALLAGELDLYV